MSKKPFHYDARLSGKENMQRLFIDSSIPEELVDNIELLSVHDAASAEFDEYTKKQGNTAVKTKFTGQLAQLTKKPGMVFFYHRCSPIPDIWEDRIMMVRDSELLNVNYQDYIKSRWLSDGFPYVGETLTFNVKNKTGILAYGRNNVEVKPSLRSYGLVGTGIQQVQYYVDLAHTQAKYVVTVNPFAALSSTTRKDGYIELTVPSYNTVQETETKLLDRYLKEAYGATRAAAILEEIVAESILLKRDNDFDIKVLRSGTPEEELESRIGQAYPAVQLYTLDREQVEDEHSKVVGNIRLLIAKSDLAELFVKSGKFELNTDLATSFVSDRPRSFIFNTIGQTLKVEVALGKVEADKIEETVTRLLRLKLGTYADSVVITKTEEDRVAGTAKLEITPALNISDYVGGKINVVVNYIADENNDNEPAKLVILSYNLNGFSKVSKG